MTERAILGNISITITSPTSYPAWFQAKIDAGLGLYQWCRVPNSYWPKLNWGADIGLKSASETSDPDWDFRSDPEVSGTTWNNTGWTSSVNDTPGHYKPISTSQTATQHFLQRLIDSGTAMRRSDTTVFFQGAGHDNSWRNDVAWITLGSDVVTRGAVIPPTPYDKIKHCGNVPGTHGAPHYRGANPPGEYGWYLVSQGADRFHSTKFLDGRPIMGHAAFRNIWNDENDLLMRMGSGLMRIGGGASYNIEAWRWATKDWDIPLDYVDEDNVGAGLPMYGELIPWPENTAQSGYPGVGGFQQPFCKLIGANTVIIPRYELASTTPVPIFSYSFPGPGFTQIGTMEGMNTTTFSENNYSLEKMVHDPVRNRILMVNNYIYRKSLGFPPPTAQDDWRIQEGDYAYARMGYLDLNGTGNIYNLIPEATYNASPALKAITSRDSIAFDEHNDRYLVFFSASHRDPRADANASGSSSTITYASQGGLFAGQMQYGKVYAIDPVSFLSTEIATTPDPVYGVPPGKARGAWGGWEYSSQLKAMVYIPLVGDRVSPMFSSSSLDAFGVSGGQYIWIMRVG